jgi:hypothetical protein
MLERIEAISPPRKISAAIAMMAMSARMSA